MMRVTEFDPSCFLDSDEVVAEYLTAALEDANPDVFLAAADHVAKTRESAPLPSAPSSARRNAS
jgi:DNA-binding phage protein